MSTRLHATCIAVFVLIGTMAVAAVGRNSTVKIVAFGDSTTATRDGIDAVFAQVLAKKWPKQGVPCEIINAGVGSNTTTLAVARLKRDVLDHKPQIVIIQFGLNDAAVDVYKSPPASNPRVSLTDYRNNLREIIDQVKAAGSHVILMTPNPMCWTDETRRMYGKPPYDVASAQGFNVILTDYVAAVRQIAKEKRVPLVDIYELFQRRAALPGRSLSELMPDGVHPSGQAHQMIADLLIAEISRL